MKPRKELQNEPGQQPIVPEIKLGWVRDLAAKRQPSRESGTGLAESEGRKWKCLAGKRRKREGREQPMGMGMWA